MTYRYINDTVQNTIHVSYTHLAMYLSSLVINLAIPDIIRFTELAKPFSLT